jgi:hypothetical protein
LNLWTQQHTNIVLDTLEEKQMYHMLTNVLNGHAASNQFLLLSTKQKFEYVQRLHSRFNGSREIEKALSYKYYAPYLLLILTERDRFMKMTDFHVYHQALKDTTQLELEEISKVNDHDERFLKFLRYVQMLDESDVKQKEG